MPAGEARFPSGSRRSRRFLVIAREIPDLTEVPPSLLPERPHRRGRRGLTLADVIGAVPLPTTAQGHRFVPGPGRRGPPRPSLIANLERQTQASGPSPDGDKIPSWEWPTWMVGGGHHASGCLQHFPRRHTTNPR